MTYTWLSTKFNKEGTKQWADEWKRKAELAVGERVNQIKRHERNSLVAHPFATSPKCLFGTSESAEETLKGLIRLKYTIMLAEADETLVDKKNDAPLLYMQNKLEAFEVVFARHCDARGMKNEYGDSKTLYENGFPLLDLRLQLKTLATDGEQDKWDEAMSVFERCKDVYCTYSQFARDEDWCVGLCGSTAEISGLPEGLRDELCQDFYRVNIWNHAGILLMDNVTFFLYN